MEKCLEKKNCQWGEKVWKFHHHHHHHHHHLICSPENNSLVVVEPKAALLHQRGPGQGHWQKDDIHGNQPDIQSLKNCLVAKKTEVNQNFSFAFFQYCFFINLMFGWCWLLSFLHLFYDMVLYACLSCCFCQTPRCFNLKSSKDQKSHDVPNQIQPGQCPPPLFFS